MRVFFSHNSTYESRGLLQRVCGPFLPSTTCTLPSHPKTVKLASYPFCFMFVGPRIQDHQYRLKLETAAVGVGAGFRCCRWLMHVLLPHLTRESTDFIVCACASCCRHDP